MKILAIETSCDETAAAVVEDGVKILSNVVASSTAMHEKYGGIVPEIAAREQLKCIIPAIEEATRHVSYDAVAVAVGPGLIGSLLIGVEAAKTIAFVTGKPIIPVNHVLAHMYANFLISHQSSDISYQTKKYLNSSTMKQLNSETIEFPVVSLVVSGGHTELFLMENKKELKWLGGTIDDAAGEAFDKTARLLGFGSRGGVAVQEAARKYDVRRACRQAGNTMYDVRIKFPRPMMHDDTLNFSFSGLKTAVMREINKLKELKQFNNMTTRLPARQVQQCAHEVQEAITDVLVSKTLKAAKLHQAKSILISGGVAANERLRNKFVSAMEQLNNVTIAIPPVSLCTDNAAYIGSYAYYRGIPEDWHTVTAIPDLSVEV